MSLRKELAALQADKARLDWLETQITTVRDPFLPSMILGYQWEVSGKPKECREAIDAARKEKS